MRGKVQTIALVVLCLVAGEAEARADVRRYAKVLALGQVRETVQTIEIHGLIQPEDVARLEALLQTAGPGAVELNSPGGDVTAAMALGRILRRERRSVVIGPDQQCVSACVLVLAGAIDRGVFSGKVGIHRPYLPRDAATTVQEQKDQYAHIEKLVKSYLAEMNVDQRLYDDMLRISPLAVRYLTEEELRAYGLFGRDPYDEQAVLAYRAKQLGITIPELFRRWNAMHTECTLLEDVRKFLSCQGAIEYGLSREEYDRRDTWARNVCASLSGTEWSACHDRVIRESEKK